MSTTSLSPEAPENLTSADEYPFRPAAIGLLSAVVPGIGHIFIGQRRKGMVLLVPFWGTPFGILAIQSPAVLRRVPGPLRELDTTWYLRKLQRVSFSAYPEIDSPVQMVANGTHPCRLCDS